MGGRHRRVKPRRRSPGLWRALAAATVAVLVLSTATALGLLPTQDQGTPPVAAGPPDPPVPPLPLPLRPPKPPVVVTTTIEPPPPAETREVVPAEKATSTPEAEPTSTTPPPPPPPPPAPPEPSGSCPTELKGTLPHVAAAGHHIAQRFGVPISQIGGIGDRPGNPTSDHPRGLALDFVVVGAKADEIADYAVERRAELAVTYVIWNRRIWSDTDRGWRPYSGASPHTDHVHISFEASGDVDVTC